MSEAPRLRSSLRLEGLDANADDGGLYGGGAGDGSVSVISGSPVSGSPPSSTSLLEGDDDDDDFGSDLQIVDETTALRPQTLPPHQQQYLLNQGHQQQRLATHQQHQNLLNQGHQQQRLAPHQQQHRINYAYSDQSQHFPNGQGHYNQGMRDNKYDQQHSYHLQQEQNMHQRGGGGGGGGNSGEGVKGERVVSATGKLENSCCNNRFWCVSDCCGIVCVVFTWLLVFYAEFVVVKVILLPEVMAGHAWSAVNLAIFQSAATLALVSHTRTMLTDPGAVPRGNATKENIQRMGLKEGQVIFKCSKCCSIKPERAHHCSVCQRCIRKMDHHCPWVNNCVGENNQKYFVLFTLYIALMSFHALFLAIKHFIGCMGSDWHECPAYSPPATIIFLLFLMFEGLLFALFTSIMFGTQVTAIWHDQTGIESLKKEEARWVRKSRWKSIQAVFGRFSIHWFSPFAHVPPPSKSHGYLFSV